MTLSPALRAAAQQQVLRRPLTPVPPPATRRMHCVDVSNYTSLLTPEALQAWKDEHDVAGVIVQAIDPPPGYPPGVTREQIEACAAAGLPTDVYLYLWTHSNVEADMRAKLALLNGLEQHVGRLWLDVEDTTAASVTTRLKSIRQALAVLDGWSMAHGKQWPAIYSGRWWWTAYVADTTEFSGRLLWTSQYDLIEDATVFTPYGGWASCALKQYTGTSMLGGVSGVDLNILAP